MKKNYTKFILFGLISFLGTGLCFGQIISQYVDTDSGTTPKGVEIWNNTGATLDFSTNNLVIERYTNGSNTSSTEVTINTGSLNAGEVLVIGGSDLATWMSSNYPSVTFINDPFSFNGDDALEVIYGGTRTDVFGTIGQDPGTSWNGGGVSTEDSNIELLSSINTGTTTGFTDPSTRFEVAEADPSILTGFGVAPTNAGITLGTVSGNTTEAGGTATFTVVLDEQPATDVVLDVTSADTGEVTVSPSILTFTNANWDTPQVITATGQDDALTDGDIDVTIDVVVDNPNSDNVYDGLSVSTIITNEDDEGPTLLYDADFSNNGDGFADHTTSNPPAPAPASVGPFGAAPNQWSLSYTTAPNTDTTNNSFSVDGSALVSNDWGGQGVFESQIIDVSAINSVDITALSTIQGANDNDFVYFYILDGNPRVQIVVNFSGLSNGDPINYSITSLDVSTNSTLVVGFEFDENGLGNGYETTSFLVEGIPAASITYTYDNGWNTNPIGVSTSSDDVEVVSGTAVISGTLIGNNLTVSSGATLDLDSSSVLEIDGNITNDGTILFRSDATGSAQLADATGATITGDVTVERYFSNNRAFRLLASPVTTTNFISNNWQQNTHITGASGTIGQTSAGGFDETPTGNPSMYTFDNANSNGGTQNDDWQAIANTNATNLSAETPYLLFVRGDRSIDLTNNSASSATTLQATGSLFTSSSTQTLNEESEGFSFIANPYQAKVNFNNLTFGGIVNSNFMYAYDPSTKDYVTLESPVNDANMFLNPGQSVFVVNQASTGASSIEFQQADINTNGSPTTTVFSEDPLTTLHLELYNSNNELKEILRLRFEENAANSINSFDAPKLSGSSENLASVNSGNLYTIERRSQVQNSDIVPLHLANYQESNYQFQVNLENWDSNTEVFVVDGYLGTTTQINSNQPYGFSVDANIPESIAEDRFSLVFDNTTLGIEDNTFGINFSLFPNPTSNGQFSIKTPNISGNVNVEITNLLGQQVFAQELSVEAQEVYITASNLSNGVYIVKLSQSNQSYSSKLIVE